MFKIYNALAVMKKNDDKAITFFDSAGKAFPKWDLIAKNNLYGRLYKQQKYEELSGKLNKVIDKDCNMQNEKISGYCENIFYLQGLVQYRLGKDKNDNEQKKFYQNAIDEFQKTLAINPDNKWAKENIEFILQQSAKKQKQQQSDKNQKQQDGKDSKDGQNNQDNQDSQSENEGENKQDSQQKQNSRQNRQDEQGEKSDKKNQNSEGTDKSDKDEVGKSRLPQNIQDALEEAQKKMEQDQGQEGFNRSKSAAQKNKYNNQDPFEQMIQQFFGEDMGIVNNEKNFSKEIQNPNEKDW